MYILFVRFSMQLLDPSLHLYYLFISYALCIVHQWKRTSILNYLVHKNLFLYLRCELKFDQFVPFNACCLKFLPDVDICNPYFLCIWCIYHFIFILSVLDISLHKQYFFIFTHLFTIYGALHFFRLPLGKTFLHPEEFPTVVLGMPTCLQLTISYFV